MFVFVTDLLFEEVFNFFKIGQGINIRNFVLFWIVVYFVVVQLMVTTYSSADSFKKTFTFDQQVGQDVVLTDLSEFHKNIQQTDTINITSQLRILINSQLTLQFKMQERGYSIDFDTSLKKYPLDKYYKYHELDQLTNHAPRSRTIEYATKSRPSKKTSKSKTKKKSLMSTKTMTSSRIRGSSRNNQTLVSITPDNFKAFTKQQVAAELHHYKELCLDLRKDNHSLKTKLDNKSRQYKDNLVELQKKINKFNQRKLLLKEKELQNQRQILKEQKSKEKVKSGKNKCNKPIQHRQMQGQFKRFFLNFLDQFGRVDDRIHKRLHQKQLEGKIILGQKLLRQGCDFLLQKKYKFNCISE